MNATAHTPTPYDPIYAAAEAAYDAAYAAAAAPTPIIRPRLTADTLPAELFVDVQVDAQWLRAGDRILACICDADKPFVSALVARYNSHAALVAALKGLMKVPFEPTPNGVIATISLDRIAAARAALAAAKGTA
jgi:hypothetical protein